MKLENLGLLQSLTYVLWRQNVVSGITTSINATTGNAVTDPQYATLALSGNVKWFVSYDGFQCNPSLKISETAAVKSRSKSNNSNERQFPTTLDEKNTVIKQHQNLS